MAMTQDQIMMLAHLADWAGSKMAPDNPFAGYAQQYVAARNFAQMLQSGTQAGKTEGGKGGEGGKEDKTSSLAPPNPFAFESGRGVSDWAPNRGYLPDVELPVSDLLSQAMEPGVKAVIDEGNKLTLTRELPTQQQTDFSRSGSLSGGPNTGTPYRNAAQSRLPNSVTNPFWSLG